MAWSLHRDLGFPLDLVHLMLEERGVQVDRQELDRLMAENHKVRVRSRWRYHGNTRSLLSLPSRRCCVFHFLPQVASDAAAGGRSHAAVDVLSLAELQRLAVPHTDDGLKYQYRLEQGRYGRRGYLHR